jgi:hypothetical protein
MRAPKTCEECHSVPVRIDDAVFPTNEAWARKRVRLRASGARTSCASSSAARFGTVELKGLPVSVPAWQVVSANRTLGQFEALRSGTTPLVGRDEEMELLLRRWAQAKAGNGRVVLISAEPGATIITDMGAT